MTPESTVAWSPIRKIAFRFTVIYCIGYLFYTWLRFRTIPGLTQLYKFIWPVWRGIVEFVNDNIFEVSPTLVDPTSSTDTSLSWASHVTMLLIAFVLSAAWSLADRKQTDYERGEYWLRVALRYFIAYFALYYGIIKLFALQMPSPTLSQLATPLGDFSPTRIAWMFFGASTPYQIFSGIIETSAGLFLMFRRTTTLGAILSFATFANILALNFGYDVSAKLMSIHFLLFIAYLLVPECNRIIDFFSNRPTTPTTSYQIDLSETWQKYARIAAKLAFVYLAIVSTILLSIRTYRSYHLEVDTRPIEQGMYDIEHFSLNGDSVLRNRDSIIWKDMLLYGVTGSIKTADTLFAQRYSRGYFSFEVDTVAKQLKLKRDYYDNTYIMQLNYDMPDPKTIRLSGMMRTDSLHVVLRKSNKVFRLSEEAGKFQWIQEATK